MKRAAIALLLVAACRTSGPAPQNPSPMVDATRAHERIERKAFGGTTLQVEEILPKPVELFVPAEESSDLLIHFHGAPFVVAEAVARAPRPIVAASVHLGAGSRVYEEPFLEARVLENLVDAIAAKTGRRFDRVWLSAFSAGYGAVRAILRHEESASRVDGVLLLDGLHTGYLAGRRLEKEKLQPFVRYARRAMEGRARFVLTHSEIFPGTFASTTETADFLLAALGLRRTPVLRWGALGMQQVSEACGACGGGLAMYGFAGNSAPDHIDHLHALPEFVAVLLAAPAPCRSASVQRRLHGKLPWSEIPIHSS